MSPVEIDPVELHHLIERIVDGANVTLKAYIRSPVHFIGGDVSVNVQTLCGRSGANPYTVGIGIDCKGDAIHHLSTPVKER